MKGEENVKKPITMAEAKEFLEKINLDEADQIQKRTIDYLIKFTKLKAKVALKIKSRLIEEVRLTEEEAIEVTNILPSSVGELNTIIAGWRKILPTEKKNQILNIINEEKDKGD
ncbi:MAG: RNA polymerase Rpb4 [Nitrososphaeria archaeon]